MLGWMQMQATCTGKAAWESRIQYLRSLPRIGHREPTIRHKTLVLDFHDVHDAHGAAELMTEVQVYFYREIPPHQFEPKIVPINM
jgi:hypothetical protein